MYSAPSLRSALRAIEAAVLLRCSNSLPANLSNLGLLGSDPRPGRIRKTLSNNARIERALLLGGLGCTPRRPCAPPFGHRSSGAASMFKFAPGEFVEPRIPRF